jgi:nicotinate-nucleotide adenylyltransferase
MAMVCATLAAHTQDQSAHMPTRHVSHCGCIAARPPAAERGRRIGLLGGTFNPPHDAHVLISEIALRRLRLGQVWWLVTPGNPLKAGRPLPSIEDRAAACRVLARDPRIVVTTFEARLPTAYTAATLEFLTRRAPDAAFVWLMGADGLAHFHRWHAWRRIFATVPIAVIDRPGWHLKAAASPAALTFAGARRPELNAAALPGSRTPAWSLITGPLSPLSSTELRRRAAAGTGSARDTSGGVNTAGQKLEFATFQS